MVVGATIGAGILRTPGDIAAALPTPLLYLSAWVLGGLYSLAGANSWSELGAMIPTAGGPYVYARRAFGTGMGFFVGYADWINWCLGPVVLSLVVGEYLPGLFPALAGHATACAFGVVIVLGAFQWIGVRSGGWMQQATTVLKVAAIAVLIVAAFLAPHATIAPAAVTVPHGLPLLLAFGVAMQGVIFTYDSFHSPVYCGEDMTDPARQIPRAVFRGLWLVIGMYLMINLAYLIVVPVSRMAGDPFVGATMARAIFGPRGDTVIRVVMIVSVLGAINAQLMAIARIAFAMGRGGVFPRVASHVNRGGTPDVALGAGLLVIFGFLLSGGFDRMLAIDTLVIVAVYSCAFASVFQLRRTEPDTPRPYRARGYPLIPALALLGSLAMVAAVAAADPVSAVIVAAVFLVSWPVAKVIRRSNVEG